jgi:hypothetical protein
MFTSLRSVVLRGLVQRAALVHCGSRERPRLMIRHMLRRGTGSDTVTATVTATETSSFGSSWAAEWADVKNGPDKRRFYEWPAAARPRVRRFWTF